MSEFSYPFDSGPGATITEDQWSYMASPWQDDGVLAEGPWDSPLKVTSAGESLILHVAAGRANIAGFHFYMDTARTISFTSNSTSFVRKDLLVLKLNRTTNTISFVYKTGTPSASPISPPIYLGWDSPEIFLATITVLAGASTVSSGNVSDDRDFVGRRVQVARNAFGLPRGSVSYNPDDDSVYVTRTSTIDALATDADLTAHTGGTDPHPQYQTQTEGDARYIRNNTDIGNVTLVSGFSNNSQTSIYRRIGNICNVLVSIRNDTGTDLHADTKFGTIPVGVAPWYSHYVSAAVTRFTNVAEPAGILFVNPAGELWIGAGASWVLTSARLFASFTYLIGV